MNINEIYYQRVKASKGSITVKDDNGKTIGIVHELTRFMDLQANMQINYFKTIKNAGIWSNSKIKIENCYILNKKIYLLRDLKTYRYFDSKEKELQDNLYNNIENFNIKVIVCYLL